MYVDKKEKTPESTHLCKEHVLFCFICNPKTVFKSKVPQFYSRGAKRLHHTRNSRDAPSENENTYINKITPSPDENSRSNKVLPEWNYSNMTPIIKLVYLFSSDQTTLAASPKAPSTSIYVTKCKVLIC